ncbi:MAG: hypothetical protein LBN38_00655 [Verrucomicrobiota bacterium]|jgi:uncharacterized alkaline shock family protein YloU|nr:hypothetical protein [Verrucomicrobiota bacterium]
MKIIHFLLGFILYIAIAAAGLALMLAGGFPECAHQALNLVLAWPVWVRVLIGAGLLVYLFTFLLTGLSWRRRRSFITFENENGTVSVNTDAIQKYLDGLKDEFAAIVWLKSALRAKRGALQVGLVLGVRAGTQIPELGKLVQVRVREILEEHLGACDLEGIAVEVNEIRSRKRGADIEAG